MYFREVFLESKIPTEDELSYDLSNRAVTSKEIGSYNKKFLTKGKPADEVHFAGWINNAKVDSLVDILEADKDQKAAYRVMI